jgi:hypothetical protein
MGKPWKRYLNRQRVQAKPATIEVVSVAPAAIEEPVIVVEKVETAAPVVTPPVEEKRVETTSTTKTKTTKKRTTTKKSSTKKRSVI